MEDVPSSTLPSRSLFPETNKRDSQREVLPVPPWPITAKFLRDLDSYFAMKTPFNISIRSLQDLDKAASFECAFV
jgi:hypothetical protein